jgi:hypothetical protein
MCPQSKDNPFCFALWGCCSSLSMCCAIATKTSHLVKQDNARCMMYKLSFCDPFCNRCLNSLACLGVAIGAWVCFYLLSEHKWSSLATLHFFQHISNLNISLLVISYWNPRSDHTWFWVLSWFCIILVQMKQTIVVWTQFSCKTLSPHFLSDAVEQTAKRPRHGK